MKTYEKQVVYEQKISKKGKSQHVKGRKKKQNHLESICLLQTH